MLIKRDDGTVRSSHFGYTPDVYENPDRYRSTIDATRAELQHLMNPGKLIDAIAFRGSSGCAMGYPLAYLTGISPLYIRKPQEICHGSETAEGPGKDIRRYVIVDDFISSGATVRAILRALHPAKCAAILLYGSNSAGMCREDRIAAVPVIHTNPRPQGLSHEKN